MVIDYTFFSYGAGLVICGFLAGVCVNAVMSAVRAVR